jgi:hypothetical protein
MSVQTAISTVEDAKRLVLNVGPGCVLAYFNASDARFEYAYLHDCCHCCGRRRHASAWWNSAWSIELRLRGRT